MSPGMRRVPGFFNGRGEAFIWGAEAVVLFNGVYIAIV